MDRLASLHKGIFNIVNSDDFVHYLPMEAWGFDKYGKTAKISLGDNYEKEWLKLTGERDYKRDAGMQNTINALADVAEDRNDCYAYTCDCHGDGSRDDITASYWSQFPFNHEKVIEKIPANARKYCQITLYNPELLGEYYGFEICQTPAYYMQLMADVSANDSLINRVNFAINHIISPRYKKAHKCVVSSALGGVTHPHYLETYYLLSTHMSGAMFE